MNIHLICVTCELVTFVIFSFKCILFILVFSCEMTPFSEYHYLLVDIVVNMEICCFLIYWF